MAFIRILSPKRAPPVFRFEGSTEIIPIVFLGKSNKKRRTNSSTKLDFPAPALQGKRGYGIDSKTVLAIS